MSINSARYAFAASVCLSSIALMGHRASAATGVTIGDNGFESPNLGSGDAYRYAPTGIAWGFSALNPTFAGAGIAASGSEFGVNNVTNGNSDGTRSTNGQAAFIQEGDGTIGHTTSATMDQMLTLPAGSYTLSFTTEGRTLLGANTTNPMTVQIYDQSMTSTYLSQNFSPISNLNFNPVTDSFTVPSNGNYYLYFVGDGVARQDVATLIDNVAVTPVPEPMTAGLVAITAMGVLGRRRLLGR